MILRNWTVLLYFEMVYKIIGISFLFPFFEYSLSLLPKIIGDNYLSQENILKLLYNPLAVLLIIGICLLAGLFVYFELTALMLYSEKGWRQERITVWVLLKETIEHPILLHCDQGVQYSSAGYYHLLSQYSVVQNMSRAGNPYDNAIMESFYRILKRELVQDAHYDNPEQARMDICNIETYYNTKRIHSALGWLSPIQFESQSTTKIAASSF